MSFKYNPLTGGLDLVRAGVSIPPTYQAEKFELDATDISNKYVVLAQVPNVTANVRMQIIGGCEQDNGVDFEVTADDGGKRISWNGLALDGILSDTDKIIIIYKT
jgi:hypothetical protein